MKKRFIIFVLGLSFLFAACGGGQKPATEETKAPVDTVKKVEAPVAPADSVK